MRVSVCVCVSLEGSVRVFLCGLLEALRVCTGTYLCAWEAPARVCVCVCQGSGACSCTHVCVCAPVCVSPHSVPALHRHRFLPSEPGSGRSCSGSRSLRPHCAPGDRCCPHPHPCIAQGIQRARVSKRFSRAPSPLCTTTTRRSQKGKLGACGSRSHHSSVFSEKPRRPSGRGGPSPGLAHPRAERAGPAAPGLRVEVRPAPQSPPALPLAGRAGARQLCVWLPRLAFPCGCQNLCVHIPWGPTLLLLCPFLHGTGDPLAEHKLTGPFENGSLSAVKPQPSHHATGLGAGGALGSSRSQSPGRWGLLLLPMIFITFVIIAL